MRSSFLGKATENSALSRGIIDPDTLLRVLVREVSPSASSASGLSRNASSASVF